MREGDPAACIRPLLGAERLDGIDAGRGRHQPCSSAGGPRQPASGLQRRGRWSAKIDPARGNLLVFCHARPTTTMHYSRARRNVCRVTPCSGREIRWQTVRCPGRVPFSMTAQGPLYRRTGCTSGGNAPPLLSSDEERTVLVVVQVLGAFQHTRLDPPNPARASPGSLQESQNRPSV
jgi:hypothetical protein